MSDHVLPRTPFKFILYFLEPYKWYFLGLACIGIIWAIDLSLRPYFVKLMLDKLEDTPSRVSLFRVLMLPGGAYILLIVSMNLMYRLHDYLSMKMMPCFNRDIVLRMLSYAQHHSHAYFQNHFGGSIAAKISEMADACQSIIDTSINRFFSHSIALIVACYTMATVHYHLAIILIVWTTLFIFSSYFLSKESHDLSHQLSEAHTTLIGKVIDSITNMLAVRLFAREKYEYSYIASQARQTALKAQQLRWSNLKQQAVMETGSNIFIGVLLCYLIYARQKGQVTIGDFALVLTLSISVIDSMWHISQDFLEFSENLGRCSQTLSLVVIRHEIIDVPGAVPLVIIEGEIEYQNVCFGYWKNNPLFDDLSVKIDAKQKIGLVGYSGSGKTTFVNLMIRLFDVRSGKILIDEQDIAHVTQDSLHENISFIPQDPLLFHRSILENIRYGKPEATDEEAIEAAIKANVDEFVRTFPGGYSAMVGERGVKLSGGQRQRIAIARAILKDAKILILDEATAALDSVTEHYIQESLHRLMQHKTVFIVAHRLSTLLNMDRVLVFDKGQIVQDGRHRALMVQKGIYAELWHRQVGGFLPLFSEER